jgi:aspartyl-tRNA(Asn)/glutamyl-tRNA(Gln) amidotransferase subunit A
MQLYKESASNLSKMLKNKEISSTELTKSVFEQINKVENEIGAYITLNEENALKKAAEVDKKIATGESLSPIAGIPVGVKDNIVTNGILTTCASKMLYNFVPPYNATVVEKLISNDAVITGKLNMDEFAMGSSTETSYFKKTKNPRNTQYVPGGSSGGSAAAVAADECIFSLGSDTGGSIRQPASYCGVVGLKPTYSSVSRYGLIAFASSLDQIGPIAKNVKDVAMLYSAICGHDTRDMTTSKREYPDFSSLIKADVKGKKIGIPKEYFSQGVNEEVKNTVINAAKELQNAGAELLEISLPSTEYALSAYYIISSAEASSNLARFDGVKYGYRTENFKNLNEMYEKTRSEGFGSEVQRRIMLGTFVLSSGYYDAYYKRAKLLQKNISDEFSKAFEKCDVILTPTAPNTAFKIGEKIDSPLEMYASDVCTVPINIAGLPAISLPCGNDKNNMPIGMQLIGPKFSEQLLFDVAHTYETIRG